MVHSSLTPRMPVSGGRPLSSDGAQAPSSPLDACNTHNINVNGAEELKSTLKTKKSWFGSLRDVVQKGALQAKAAVDLLRTDRHKAELYKYLQDSTATAVLTSSAAIPI